MRNEGCIFHLLGEDVAAEAIAGCEKRLHLHDGGLACARAGIESRRAAGTLHNNAQVNAVDYTPGGIEVNAVLDDILYGRLRDFVMKE